MTRRRRLTAALAVFAAVASAVGVAGSTPTAQATVPPSQRVVMFTDSVGLGAEYALPRAFPPGWQVVVDGRPAEMVGELEANFVRPRLATNPEWFGDHVVIAAGYNFSYWDHPRFNREVDSLIATLTAAGVEHVYWMTLREVKPEFISAGAWRQIQPYSWYFPTVNRLLEEALGRHPNLRLVDWAANADRSGITYDAIHLNNTGAALFSNLIRAAVDGAATTVPDRATVRIDVPGAAGAAAVAFNATTTHPRTSGFLTAHPCGAVPLVSMHNYVRDEIAAHSGIVPLDPGGGFCITTHVSTNLVVDVTGVYAAGADFAAAKPTRWVDTRELPRRAPVRAGEILELDLASVRRAAGVGGSPRAVAVAATSVGAGVGGWLRVVTCGAEADTSNVNYAGPAPTPNQVIVELSEAGTICVETNVDTHVVVDLFGVFDDTSPIRAADPRRLLDTRERGTRVGFDSVTEIVVADPDDGPLPKGVVLNLTVIDPVVPTFATAYPCAAGRPSSSSINVAAGIASNAAIVAPDQAGKVCVYNLAAAHLVVDLMGDAGDAFTGRRPLRLLDTRER